MSHNLEIKRYTRIKRVLSVTSFMVSVVFLALLLFAGLSIQLRSWVSVFAPQAWLLVLVYVVVLSLVNELLHLPLSFFSGHVIEHRYHLSNQTLARWLFDQFKGFILSLCLAVAAGELVYFTLRRFPADWWWMCAVVFILFAVVMAQLAPLLLFPLFYRFEPLRDENLKNRLVSLCERTHTRVRGVYNWKLSEKSNKANAAVVGLGRTRRIILSDTLLSNFSEDEIEVILAHEVGHHVHYDTWKGISIQTVFTFAVFYLIQVFLGRLTTVFRFASISDVANLPLLMGLSAVFGILALPATNGYSRRAERAADRFALEMTQKTEAFISSMEKLGEKNMAEQQPNRWIEFVFHSHPSLARRIARAREWRLSH